MQILIDYHSHWFVLATACALLINFDYIRPRIGWFAATTISVVVISGIWYWLWRDNRYAYLKNPHDALAMRYFAADSVLKLYLVIVAILAIPNTRDQYKACGRAGALVFCTLNGLVVLYQFASHYCVVENSCGALLGNPSMNSSLMACAMPLLFNLPKQIKWPAIAITVASIFAAKSSIAMGILALELCVWAILVRPSLLWFVPLPIVLGGIYVGPGFFSSTGRAEMWIFFISKWYTNKDHYLYGTGLGTFKVFATNLQDYFQLHAHNIWIWMHSDWLQTVFELGILGTVSLAGLYLYTLWVAYKDKLHCELTAMMGFGAFMLLNYPLHLAFSSFFGAWLTVTILSKRRFQ